MLRSKINISTFVLCLIGGTGAAIFGIYMASSGIASLAFLIFGLPFIILGLYSIYSTLNSDTLIITPKELIINSLIGRTKKAKPLNELKFYTAIEKENAKQSYELSYMKWEDLVLYGDNIEYKISSSSYSNYSVLKKTLIRGLKRNKDLEKEWERKNSMQWGYGLLASGFILGVILFRDGIPEEEIGSSTALVFIILFPIIAGLYLIKNYKKASR